MKILRKFSLRKLLYNKRFSIILSVAIAFTLWLIVTINQKPIIDRTLSDISVNVNLENTFAAENKLSIVGDISQQKFTVVVRGPSYAVGALTPEQLGLYASAATVEEPGNYKLEVAATATTANAEYEIVSISPQTLSIDFDYIDTKEYTITANAEGVTAAEGLIAETGVVSGVESDTVTIKGPRMVLNKIESVVALAKVNKTLSASETFDADIILYDENEKVIDTTNLNLSFNKIKVTVPISKKKTVPVKAVFSNVPDKFDASSLKLSIDHSEVTIIGTPESVDKVTEVSLSSIDLTAVSPASNSYDVSPKLPEGVRLLDNIEDFTVKIDLTGYVERTITVSKVRYVDVANGLAASGAQSIKNVRILGPKNVVNRLDPKTAYATVSLKDKLAGAHTVNTVISFEKAKNVWTVGTYTATVTLK